MRKQSNEGEHTYHGSECLGSKESLSEGRQESQQRSMAVRGLNLADSEAHLRDSPCPVASYHQDLGERESYP